VSKLKGHVVDIDAGWVHTCAVTSEGTAKCWGNNKHGQLGDGSTHDRHQPVKVLGIGSDVVAVASGDSHSCALTIDGAVWCWGLNRSGQLGDGSEHERHVAVPVVGLTAGVVAISAGGFHSCALTDADAMLCWGANFSGQLGDGTKTDRDQPVPVSGAGTSIVQMEAGTYHTCAVTGSGRAWCWGESQSGRLGTGLHGDQLEPARVRHLGTNVSQISAGLAHTCAVLESGDVKCWGLNIDGQIGDGTYPNIRRFPTNVRRF
jgi:alpha-tubulin suppressor-like RCC1 family protein